MSRPEADSYRTCTIVHESNKGETNKPEKMRAPLFENTYTECKIFWGAWECVCAAMAMQQLLVLQRSAGKSWLFATVRRDKHDQRETGENTNTQIQLHLRLTLFSFEMKEGEL